MSRETFESIVIALITLGVLAVMAYGQIASVDVGPFRDYGAIVIGYYFGAKAQGAVSKALSSDGVKLPSVL